VNNELCVFWIWTLQDHHNHHYKSNSVTK